CSPQEGSRLDQPGPVPYQLAAKMQLQTMFLFYSYLKTYTHKFGRIIGLSQINPMISNKYLLINIFQSLFDKGKSKMKALPFYFAGRHFAAADYHLSHFPKDCFQKKTRNRYG